MSTTHAAEGAVVSSVSIASVMLCPQPRHANGRHILSCCDSVWEPADVVPFDLKPFFTDELGNLDPSYGGFLQLREFQGLAEVASRDLYVCFRAVADAHLALVQTNPPSDFYTKLMPTLDLVGWDIATGNGWLSASCHGCYPIDPFTGMEADQSGIRVNRYGLFDMLDACEHYCELNDQKIPEHAPWYPTAIYLDRESLKRMEQHRHTARS